MSTSVTGPVEARQRWLARVSILLVCGALVLFLAFVVQRSLWLLLVAVLGVVVFVASTYGFLAHRGAIRLLASAVLVATPVALVWLLSRNGLVWVLVGVLLATGLAVLTGRAALQASDDDAVMPAYDAPPPRHPFIVMNPRSGGGKVGRFGLKDKAEALGAEVVLLEEADVDVAALARRAVEGRADLLGVAGGDGTQALVAGVAAALDVPFMVISAGTRNHFALDLGLDRRDPSRCLQALTEDAEELHVDLGQVGGRTFVNNASFGAYAAIVHSPAYRDAKAGTTLDLLPELLSGHSGARLVVHADGVTVRHPQAVLVSDNPYGMGDLAGTGRRARLDVGTLGVVALTVDDARQAVRLLRRSTRSGLVTLQAREVVVTSDAFEIPVGADGEALMLPTPVRCTIRPQALRVRVPRDRPGVPRPRARWDMAALLRLGSFSRPRSVV
jgi:diacylglycerol kinase family enzyme